MAVAVVVAGSFQIFKRKALGQSLCIQAAVKTQNELRDTLRELLRLNPQAEQLRLEREIADNALRAAQSSGYPPAIAIAQANQLQVIARQSYHHLVRQWRLIRKAERQRRSGERELRQSLADKNISRFKSRRYYPLGLAVYPTPAESLSPNYEPVANFKFFQQQRYSYDVDLHPDPLDLVDLDRGSRDYKLKRFNNKVQKAECSVSLDDEEENWKIKIVAASAQSNWLSSFF